MHKQVILMMASVITSATLTGCELEPEKVQTSYDKFSDITWHSLQLSPNARLTKTINDGTASFTLRLRYRNFGKLGDANELVVLLDGDRMSLAGSTSLDRVQATSVTIYYHEQATFPITSGQIRRLAKASDIEARMYGRGTVVPFGDNGAADLSDSTAQRRIARFYERVVFGDAPVDP